MQESHKLKYIDGLKGIAILGVMAVHNAQLNLEDLPDWFVKIVAKGAHGVQLFYIITGILIFLSLQSRLGKTYKKESVFKFYKDRIIRIAPLYYLAIVYYLAQKGLGPRYWLGDAESITTFNILSNILFINNLFPYFINSIVSGGSFVSTVMIFYVVSPILFKKIKNLQAAVLLALYSSLIMLLIFPGLFHFILIPSAYLWIEYVNIFFPAQFPFMTFGIVLYFLIFKHKPLYKKEAQLHFLFLSILFILATFYFSKNNLYLPGVALAMFVYVISQNPYQFFINKLTVFLGKHSYPIFLFHYGVLYWLHKYSFIKYIPSSIPFFGIFDYLLRYTILVVIISAIAVILTKIQDKALGKIKLLFAKNPIK
ncbi:acyltransferase [Candidatus Beckwithbacteria bacterium]|nr:acyltransferase [Candidatus Beckwithbacteria bacterium]